MHQVQKSVMPSQPRGQATYLNAIFCDSHMDAIFQSCGTDRGKDLDKCSNLLNQGRHTTALKSIVFCIHSVSRDMRAGDVEGGTIE